MAASPMRAEATSRPSAAVIAFPRCPTAGRISAGRPDLAPAELVLLERLRWLALRSQLAPKPDFERACYLLAGEPPASLDRYATAFFRGLCDRASGEMTIYRPGARSQSDDELWLLRLLACWRAGDDRRAAAFVAWRVEASSRRWMRFLSARMAASLEETSLV